jgi:hypothetical protein
LENTCSLSCSYSSTGLVFLLKQVSAGKRESRERKLIGLTIDSVNDKTLQNNAEIKITYTLNTGTEKKKTLSFVSYNQDFYALYVNGKSEFLVAKSKLQAIFHKLDILK